MLCHVKGLRKSRWFLLVLNGIYTWPRTVLQNLRSVIEGEKTKSITFPGFATLHSNMYYCNLQVTRGDEITQKTWTDSEVCGLHPWRLAPSQRIPHHGLVVLCGWPMALCLHALVACKGFWCLDLLLFTTEEGLACDMCSCWLAEWGEKGQGKERKKGGSQKSVCSQWNWETKKHCGSAWAAWRAVM